VVESPVGRVFVTRGFDKFARKERLADEVLVKRIDDANRGLIDADLNGCLVKLRIGRQGAGKSGGFRVIAAFKAHQRAFFIYGYPKNAKDNLTGVEEIYLERAGAELLAQGDEGLGWLINAGRIRELSSGLEERPAPGDGSGGA
jgi:hypothetical protein